MIPRIKGIMLFALQAGLAFHSYGSRETADREDGTESYAQRGVLYQTRPHATPPLLFPICPSSFLRLETH
jgi:hypothetical protein